MKKRMVWFMMFVTFPLLLASCRIEGGETIPQAENPGIQHSGQWKSEEQALHHFIVKQLSSEYGVYTNLKETNQSELTATGHEVLSESAGLLMRYYARTGQKAAFDRTWEQAKETFDLDSSFSYRYSPVQQRLYPLNAAVDDLRLIRALYEANTSFGTDEYQKEAKSYGDRFYSYNVQNDRLYDFYDDAYRVNNDFVTLCYLDLRTLQLLAVPQEQKQRLMSGMTDLIHNGYLSDTFPFYETRYEYSKGRYTSENINTVESLLTILHLAETGQHNGASIEFIKERVAEGKLYGQYTREGKPTNEVRSTAIYAITAIIGAEVGDRSLYDASIDRMNEFKVQDASDQLYGAFGDTATGQAYSFDNLMALLAYTYA
ncbi:hypothetical protein [Paenibacillus paeoniae]|uniref:Glycosyl hydrolase n=1 Tax=Paenibacillus paeoniae TaxID=2292705 RepID=A0A371PIW6_9BACL|nr:hypothetical protein [Paenibacillus paeoniae]REK76166.1 hypothetical protein DX130_03635 [Paenibacillus paeoniae]